MRTLFPVLAAALLTPLEIAAASLGETDVGRIVAAVDSEFGALPGVAVGVVRGDSPPVVHVSGFRDVERRLPVTPETRFAIASLTKSFVATAIRMAADRGTIDLDAPLSSVLPQLRLPAPLAPEHLALRDLLTHRSGIQNDPVSFRTSMSADVGDAEVLALLARSSVAVPRSFAYSNIGYVIAAIAVRERTGRPWQELVREEVLRPAGMSSTDTVVPGGPDAAQRYASSGPNAFTRLPPKSSASYHAAGGMSASLNDLLRWLRLNMDGGRIDGRQVFPERVIRELHTAQIGARSTFGGFTRIGYGLGWYVVDFEGETMIQCFGSHAGSRAHLSFLPSRRVGIVVLANEARDGVYLPDVIALGVYDLLLARPDAAARERARFLEQHEWIRRVRADREDVRVDHRAPIRVEAPIQAQLAGRYVSEAYGTIEIIAENGGLLARMGELSSWLGPTDSGALMADLTPGGLPGRQTLTIAREADGRVSGFTTQFGRAPTFFARMPGRDGASPR